MLLDGTSKFNIAEYIGDVDILLFTKYFIFFQI